MTADRVENFCHTTKSWRHQSCSETLAIKRWRHSGAAGALVQTWQSCCWLSSATRVPNILWQTAICLYLIV